MNDIVAESKLLKVLKTLSVKEVKRFREFIHSPYYNKNEKLKILGDHLLEDAPGFENSPIDEWTIYRRLYPGKPYHKQKIYNQLSFLLQLLRKFLIIEYYESGKMFTDNIALN